MKINPYKEIWDGVYKDKFMTIWSPPETVVQFAARFLKKRLTVDKYEEFFKAKRILDLGCGNAATVGFFARQGYEVKGLDLSPSAIYMGKQYLAKEGLKAELTSGDISDLPYKNNFFDVAICYGVLDHMEPKRAKMAVAEAHRVLRKNGLFFMSLIGTESDIYEHGKEVEKNTFILQGDWYENGTLQHYFDEKEIKSMLKGKFAIKDVRINMQKSMTPKFKELKWSYRWHITVEKI